MKTYSKLRGRMIEKFGSQRAFAKAINKTEQTVINKLNGNIAFSQKDIIEWGNALGIDKDNIGDYFFADKLQKS